MDFYLTHQEERLRIQKLVNGGDDWRWCNRIEEGFGKNLGDFSFVILFLGSAIHSILWFDVLAKLAQNFICYGLF